MKTVHTQLQPIREVGDHLFLPVASDIAYSVIQRLEQALQTKEYYQSVQIADFAPDETLKRYEYTKRLKTCGLPFPTAMLTYSHCNNVGNLASFAKLIVRMKAALLEARVKLNPSSACYQFSKPELYAEQPSADLED